MKQYRTIVVAAVVAMAFSRQDLIAQSLQRLDIGVVVATSTLRELDSHEVGLGARVGWRLTTMVGVEGDVTFFPADVPSDRAITASRTEAAAGVTIGPRLGAFRPFGRLRAGVLNMAAAPAPVACIMIFPPPLSCTLAGGRTLFMVDVGGGVELDLSARAFFRLDAGDRIVRYPGPAFSRDGTRYDDDFSGHDFRFAAGVGWRF